ncbi:MAG: ATP-binding protein [Ruminococcaceae bacterium]|nr:ATP-binding protein [Oscillospiraceae bacterium]
MNFNDLNVALSSVSLYKGVLKEKVFTSLLTLLRLPNGTADYLKAEAYADFVSALYEEGCDLGEYIENALKCDDNVYVRSFAAGKEIPVVMQEAFFGELESFSAITEISSDDLLSALGLSSDFPKFKNTKKNFSEIIPETLKNSSKLGYGVYAKYGMFRIEDAGRLTPILSPDNIRLSSLVGYENERRQVLENTKGLLLGKPAANVLLCGDAGTGKSSTVKAVANELKDEGIRLIEVRKDQLCFLPTVMGEIADNPLKFIIFVDDLSFSPDDDGFGTLKAILEGSAAAKTSNAVIYATSNRRHIVKETFSAREGDEIHRRDTIEETISLSARFGLSILFAKPDKQLYLKIVRTLAEENGIEVNSELDIKAEAFALSKGGRSARTAGQFINNILTVAE